MGKSEHHIHLHAEGAAFTEETFDLRALEFAITSLRRSLDRTVPIPQGNITLTKQLKSQLSYKVKIESGSLDLLVDLAVNQPSNFIPILVADGGQSLAHTVVQLWDGAINLRRAASAIIEKGLTPRVRIDNSSKNKHTVNYNINTGDITINNSQIITTADATRGSIDHLLRRIDGKNMQSVSVESGETRIDLTQEDSILADRERMQLDFEIEITGRLDMVSFDAQRGIIVTPDQRFQVTWDEGLRSRMHAVADIEGTRFKAKQIIDKHALDGGIVGLHIIDANNPQTGFGFRGDRS